MACINPKVFMVNGKGRFFVLPQDTVFPGQAGPVHPDYAGFAGRLGPGMHSARPITVDCRVCWSCIVKYQNSMVGALLAETAYAQQAVRFDMTYANDPGSDTRSDLAHKMLNGRHIREFAERLRKARGFGRVRYLVAGEYGPLYGRAHWHSVLIFEDGMPEFDFSADRYNDNRLWPYGFVRARPCETEAGFAYAAKYAVKSTKAMAGNPHYLPGVETVLRRSRIPPLGQSFFIDQAVKQAEYAVPLSMRYLPPGGASKANYHVRGKAVRLRMAQAYLATLAAAGHDVSFYGVPPLGYVPTGSVIPVSGDLDIARLLQEAIRERHLASLPDLSLEQEAARLVEDFAERQAKQDRINAFQAQRRAAAAVKRAKARSRALALSFRDDPDDPFWDHFDASRYALDVGRNGSWHDF